MLTSNTTLPVRDWRKRGQEDLTRVLANLHAQGKGTPLCATSVHCALVIARLLSELAAKNELQSTDWANLFVVTSDAQLRSPTECVYNNMPWFDEGNKLDLGSTTHMVHPEISNSQAKCLGIRALSTILLHVASEEHLFIIKCTR